MAFLKCGLSMVPCHCALCAIGDQVWVNSLTVIVINPKAKRGGGGSKTGEVRTLMSMHTSKWWRRSIALLLCYLIAYMHCACNSFSCVVSGAFHTLSASTLRDSSHCHCVYNEGSSRTHTAAPCILNGCYPSVFASLQRMVVPSDTCKACTCRRHHRGSC
jgi:hypothetical protein